VKVGDLVKLLDDRDVQRNNEYINPESLGLIVEWTCDDDGPSASCWIQWAGNPVWDCMYVEDLELINESR